MNKQFKDFITLLENQNLEEGLNDTIIPSLKIYKASKTGELQHAVYEPSLLVILQGSKLVSIGEYAIEYGVSSYLISSTYLPISGKILNASKEKPFLSLVINFSMDQIFDVIEKFIIYIEKRLDSNLAICRYDLDQNLFEVVNRYINLLVSQDDIDFLGELYIKEILYRLIISNKNKEFTQLAFIEGNAYKISKAITFMNENMFDPLSMEDIADHINMSISSFHKHFKTITSLSPLQYLKTHRLQKARGLMLTQDMDISGASYSVGYQSVSQFSREYSRYFGQSPSLDVKNIKNKIIESS